MLTDLTLTQSGRVSIELITSIADFRNTLSIVSPGISIVSTGCRLEPAGGLTGTAILSEKLSQRGCRVDLDSNPGAAGIQPFAAGTVLSFGMCAQTDPDSDCEFVWSSNPTANSDGQDHLRTTDLQPTAFPGRVFQLAWEDRNNLGDMDFNDLIAVVRTEIDTDGDGLWDDWEQFGIDTDANGTIDLNLPAMGANPMHKDIFLEIDFMDCAVAGGDCAAGDTHSHRPKAAAVNAMVQAFANAPVTNPDGIDGINLHVDVSNSIPHQNFLDIESPGCGGDPLPAGVGSFDAVKANAANFGATNPRRFSHFYDLFIHRRGPSTMSSGCSELPGNDTVVSLGGWNLAGAADLDGDGMDDRDVGTVQQQAGTLMHELGHNLNLHHGGGDFTDCALPLDPSCNNKPNYLSVMNYSFQFGIPPTDPDGTGPMTGRLDYSRDDLPNLDERNPPGLNEPAGIGDGTDTTVFVCPGGGAGNGPGMGPINWNCDTDSTDTGLSVDINGDGTSTLLQGFDDWDNLLFDFQTTSDFEDGVHFTFPPAESDYDTFVSLKPFSLPDRFETNDTLLRATLLGSESQITLPDLTIHNSIDVDNFKVTAAHTGKLIINAFFDDSLGDLNIEVRDIDNNIVTSSNSTDDDERLVLPVISQEAYFLRVFGANGNTNGYSLEIENFAAPIPIAIDLAAADDTGTNDTDNVTSVAAGTITMLADLSDFDDMGIEILSPQVVDRSHAGAAVEVFVQGQSRGFATTIAGTNSTLFTFTFAPGNPEFPGNLSEGLNFVTAAVRIFDGKRPRMSGRSQMSQPLLITLDTVAPATPLPPDLLASSDSGMFDNDNATNKMEPAFSGSLRKNGDDVIVGVGDRNIKVRIKADGAVVGQGLTTTAGDWEITVEPLRDKVYQMTVELEDWAGNVSSMSEPLLIEIDTLPPNTPRLDLAVASDTGRHNDDNITRDTTPDLSMTSTDPNAASHLYAPNLKLRIFDRQEESPEVLVYDSFGVLDGLTDHTQVITTLVALADGVHNLKLEAEDRAGNISDDYLLDLVVDTVAPSGTGVLYPTSDTGVSASDRVTRDATPLLTGKTEANALVRAAIDGNPAGTTAAVPLDGDEAFPPPDEFDGNYFLQTIRNLTDGEHTIRLFFQDLAGNESLAAPAATIVILVDTQGPRITNVTRGQVSTNSVISFDGATSLFEPKPRPTGPDPLVHSLVIHFSDLVDRTASFANIVALIATEAGEEGQYQLKGDHHGNVSIRGANVTFATTAGDGRPETASVELVVASPLPDDRFTLWISDAILDPAGNSLDGESGARGPFDGNDLPSETTPIFPTGDRQTGGDFHGRFTIDSRPEIGTFTLGTAYIDINGNFVFDSQGDDRDQTNRDNVFAFSDRDDWLFAGNFAPRGATSATGYDGYDKLAAYNGQRRWLFDFNNDGVPDEQITSDVRGEGIPIAGNFDPNHPGDEIGLFDGNLWYLDTNGNNNLEFTDTVLHGWLEGAPIVGDFDGDGRDDLGTWDDRRFHFDLANNGLTGAVERFIDVEEIFGDSVWPVAADMNQDGIDDVGLFVNRHEGVLPEHAGEWYVLISDGSPRVTGQINTLDHRFTPVPFGTDIFAHFGNQDVRPIVGNFDPPIRRSAIINPGDFDASGIVDAADIDLLFGQLRSNSRDGRFDLTGDGIVTIGDRHKLIWDILRTNYGDSNLDRVFNSRDLVYVFQSAEYEDQTTANSTWTEGDWNGDREFSSEDLVLAFTSGGFVWASVASNPEDRAWGIQIDDFRTNDAPSTADVEIDVFNSVGSLNRLKRMRPKWNASLKARDRVFSSKVYELRQDGFIADELVSGLSLDDLEHSGSIEWPLE
jgi:hypothetical protein